MIIMKRVWKIGSVVTLIFHILHVEKKNPKAEFVEIKEQETFSVSAYLFFWPHDFTQEPCIVQF